jgi:thiamine phosphate synthase YjbQ (UPF0047 family)
MENRGTMYNRREDFHREARLIVSKQLTLKTQGNGDTIDITPGVERAIKETPLSSGVVTLFVVGSTAALTTIEYEVGE